MKFCNDFFDVSDFKFIHNEISSMLQDKQTEYRVNLISWNENLVVSNSPVLMKALDNDNKIAQMVISKIKNIFDVQKEDDKFSVNIFYWTPGSGINWHDDISSDGNQRTAVTIYMNEEWDTDYGGFMVYEDETGFVHAVPPSPNSAVYVENNPRHSVSKTTEDAPVRMSIQVFISQ